MSHQGTSDQIIHKYECALNNMQHDSSFNRVTVIHWKLFFKYQVYYDFLFLRTTNVLNGTTNIQVKL